MSFSSASLEIEYINALSQIENSIISALNGGVRDALLAKIREKAQENVYSYPATPEAMRTRRGTIGDVGVMEVESGGGSGEYYLRITNRAVTQHPASDDESDIVEQGYSNYRQPGPREFMAPALEDIINSGEAENIIRQYISSV